MKLTDLEPQFLRLVPPAPGHGTTWLEVSAVIDAHGLTFVCPVCYLAHGGVAGAHHILCWFENRHDPLADRIGPPKWRVAGTGYADLSFTSLKFNSVRMLGGCKAHFHITNGVVRDCPEPGQEAAY